MTEYSACITNSVIGDFYWTIVNVVPITNFFNEIFESSVLADRIQIFDNDTGNLIAERSRAQHIDMLKSNMKRIVCSG